MNDYHNEIISNPRTPKSNSDFIKKWYKSSTIDRLKDHLGYKNQKNIDKCKIISEWLDLCYLNHDYNGYIQDELFDWIKTSREYNVVYQKRLDIIRKMMGKKPEINNE